MAATGVHFRCYFFSPETLVFFPLHGCRFVPAMTPRGPRSKVFVVLSKRTSFLPAARFVFFKVALHTIMFFFPKSRVFFPKWVFFFPNMFSRCVFPTHVFFVQTIVFPCVWTKQHLFWEIRNHLQNMFGKKQHPTWEKKHVIWVTNNRVLGNFEKKVLVAGQQQVRLENKMLRGPRGVVAESSRQSCREKKASGSGKKNKNIEIVPL